MRGKKVVGVMKEPRYSIVSDGLGLINLKVCASSASSNALEAVQWRWLSKCSLGLTHDQRVMRAFDYLRSLSICSKRSSDKGPAVRLKWCVVGLIDRALAAWRR